MIRHNTVFVDVNCLIYCVHLLYFFINDDAYIGEQYIIGRTQFAPTNSKPSAAGLSWRGKTVLPVDVLSLAVAHDLTMLF